MKKILSLILAALMLACAVLLVGCNKEDEKLKLGLGIHSAYDTISDADGETKGKGKVVFTAAAVLVDKDGKIVKCELDAAENEAEYTSEGKFVSKTEFKTKYEKGDSYGMVAYAGAKLEWYQQADAFEKVAVGKTLTEVKALVAEGGKGTSAVIEAGCTMGINDLVLAIEKAVNNAKDSEATANDTLKLSAATSQKDSKDASEDANGAISFETTIVAAAVNADKRVAAITSDCAVAKFTFDNKGASTTDKTAALKTKLEQGDSYGMKNENYGSKIGEWYDHAAAFNATCIGKTSAEIAGLAANGKAGDALVNAGCTVYVGDFVSAAVKATK